MPYFLILNLGVHPERQSGIDEEDQSQTRPNSQMKRLEDFVQLRLAMRMFHRRRASL